MPSGNKVIGHIYHAYINLEIYISSKTVTQGLCGSYDNNKNNDLFHRFTKKKATLNKQRVIDASTASSWR